MVAEMLSQEEINALLAGEDTPSSESESENTPPEENKSEEESITEIDKDLLMELCDEHNLSAQYTTVGSAVLYLL